jgi:hypothetical protein
MVRAKSLENRSRVSLSGFLVKRIRYRSSALSNGELAVLERLTACPCWMIPLFGVIRRVGTGAGGHFTSTLVVLFFEVHKSVDTNSNEYRPGIVGVKVRSVPAL